MQAVDTGADAEVTALNEEFAGRWHITRRASGDLDAACEPGRGYHVVAGSPDELRASLERAEANGGRLVW